MTYSRTLAFLAFSLLLAAFTWLLLQLISSSSNGLSTVYSVANNPSFKSGVDRTSDSKPIVIHKTTTSQVSHQNRVLLRSPLYLNWNYSELGVPSTMPNYQVEWRAFIKFPEPANQSEHLLGSPGLLKRVYQNPEFGGSAQTQIDSAADLKITKNDLETASSIEWDGLLIIEKSGTYEFLLNSSGNSKLYIDETLVSVSGQNIRQTRPARKELDSGAHRFLLRHTIGSEKEEIRLDWTGPESNWRRALIPTSSFSTPKTPGTFVQLQTSGAADLQIADSKVSAANGSAFLWVEPGVHPLRLRFKKNSLDERIVLNWRQTNGGYKTIPADAFFLNSSDLSSKSASTLLLWVGLIVLALSTIAACVKSIRQKFLEWFTSRAAFVPWEMLLLAAIFVLGCGLRYYQYADVPEQYETMDEYNAGWVGWSLINKGVPRGWSWSKSNYRAKQEIQPFGQRISLITPVFHPPPLFHILAGISSSLAGTSRILEVSLKHTRIPAVIASSIAILLVYILSRMLYGKAAGFASGLLFASLPLTVISGRLTKEENLLIVLLLLAIIGLLAYLQSEKKGWLYLAAACAGISCLVKQTGIVIPALLFVALLSKGRRRDALLSAAVFTPLALLYPLYGWFLDWQIFSDIIRFHSELKTNFATSLELFTNPKIVFTSFGSGWLVWLWIAGIYGFVKERKSDVLFLGLVLYLAVIAGTIQHRAVFGWYFIPIYCLLSVAAGRFLVDFVKSPSIWMAAVLMFSALASGLSYCLPTTMLESQALLRTWIAVGLLPFILYYAINRNWSLTVARIGAITLLSLFLLTNVVIVLDFANLYY